jgi:hypothetical protein
VKDREEICGPHLGYGIKNAVAPFFNMPPRKAFHLAQKDLLPGVFKIGDQWAIDKEVAREGIRKRAVGQHRWRTSHDFQNDLCFSGGRDARRNQFQVRIFWSMPFENSAPARYSGAVTGAETSLLGSIDGSENSKPRPPVQATIADLQREFAAEALTVVASYARHGADCLMFDDEPGAERALTIATAHLREGAKAFREWQTLKAAVAAPILAEAVQPWLLFN